MLDTQIADQDILEETQSNERVVNFSRPHAEFEDFTSGLTRSLKRVFTTAPRRYDAVYVLLVSWEDDDLGTVTEIDDLDELFRETYHYTTKRRTIPSIDSYNSLECTIVNFRQEYDSPDNLLIFYYGGHGVGEGALNPDNESIWAALVYLPQVYLLICMGQRPLNALLIGSPSASRYVSSIYKSLMNLTYTEVKGLRLP